MPLPTMSPLAGRIHAGRGEPVTEEALNNNAALIWSVAEILRGDYKQSEYQKVVLPLVVLRRLDCVLEPTKDLVLVRYDELKDRVDNLEPVLQATAGEQF